MLVMSGKTERSSEHTLRHHLQGQILYTVYNCITYHGNLETSYSWRPTRLQERVSPIKNTSNDCVANHAEKARILWSLVAGRRARSGQYPAMYGKLHYHSRSTSCSRDLEKWEVGRGKAKMSCPAQQGSKISQQNSHGMQRDWTFKVEISGKNVNNSSLFCKSLFPMVRASKHALRLEAQISTVLSKWHG